MNGFDQVPLLAVFLVSIFAQVAFIEIGFRYGQFRQGHGKKAQLAQVRAIMGASLGLLAFMLAFSFSMAQTHFDQRQQAYMLEVSAIDSAYRGADLIPTGQRVQAKELLHHFIRLRLETTKAARSADIDGVIERIRESERIHDMLWQVAELSMEGEGDGEDTGIFAQSVLAMINAHDARLQAALFNRISPVIWLTLFLIALSSMVVVGYQAGLTGTRSSLATWALAITFSMVMTLVIDLDRPNMTLFQMDQQLMAELENRMDGRPNDPPGLP